MGLEVLKCHPEMGGGKGASEHHGDGTYCLCSQPPDPPQGEGETQESLPGGRRQGEEERQRGEGDEEGKEEGMAVVGPVHPTGKQKWKG